MVCNLRWLLVACLSAVALAICFILGWLSELRAADPTWISFSILGLYCLMTLFVGWLTAIAPLSLVARYRKACAFVPELMTGLGMLGTVIGFVQMLGAFRLVDGANAIAVQQTLGTMAAGMGVALLTTLVGLACALALQLQLVNLDIASGEA